MNPFLLKQKTEARKSAKKAIVIARNVPISNRAPIKEILDAGERIEEMKNIKGITTTPPSNHDAGIENFPSTNRAINQKRKDKSTPTIIMIALLTDIGIERKGTKNIGAIAILPKKKNLETLFNIERVCDSCILYSLL